MPVVDFYDYYKTSLGLIELEGFLRGRLERIADTKSAEASAEDVCAFEVVEGELQSLVRTLGVWHWAMCNRKIYVRYEP